MSGGVAVSGKCHRPQCDWTQPGTDASALLGQEWFWTRVAGRLTSGSAWCPLPTPHRACLR